MSDTDESGSCGHKNAGYPVIICGNSDPEDEPDGCGAEYAICGDCVTAGERFFMPDAEKWSSNHTCEFKQVESRVQLLERILRDNGIEVPP